MPVHTTPEGSHIHYVVAGNGPPLVLTPGGREGRDAIAALADGLAAHCTVLTWDRRNTGHSDIVIDPSRSEQAIWAQDLAQLIHALDFGPAIIAGGSAGCRVSLNAVLRDPSVASAMLLWSASGGAYGSQFLGFNYHVPYILAAQRGGMAAVVQTPFFAERIAANPGNADYLLSLDPAVFIAAMKRWNESFHPRDGQPLAGIEGDLSAIAVPTLIFAGNDDIHPAESSQALAAAMTDATLIDPPWSTDEFMGLMSGRDPGRVFDLYPRMIPQMVEFITRIGSPGSER
jgi:2-hydroxy-6-oxonona-2,4-dienedioate hydrolase